MTEEEQHVRNHDNSGKPDGEHTVQENYHLKSRDNVDKFDLATDDANVDFNISGIPEEAVKRSENFNILQLIRRITRHPQKEAVQNDLDKEQSFNAFSDESKSAIMDAGNIEIPRSSMRSRSGNASLVSITVIQESYTVCGRLMTKDSAENRKYISAILDTFSIPNIYIRKDHVVTGMENPKDVKNTLRRINLQRNAVKRNMIASTTGTSATRPSERQ